jgi:imidazolonepropionase-like amidohydrolase
VLTDNGRIVGVQSALAPLPDSCALAEFPGATMLPGLIDTHVHLGGDSCDGALERLPDYRDGKLAEVIETALRRHLAAGVMTVRDLGDRRWFALPWRDRVAGGCADIARPTIVASGPPITSAKHCTCLTPSGVDMGESLLESLVERRIAVCPTLGKAADAVPSCRVGLPAPFRPDLGGYVAEGGTNAPGRSPDRFRVRRRDHSRQTARHPSRVGS